MRYDGNLVFDCEEAPARAAIAPLANKRLRSGERHSGRAGTERKDLIMGTATAFASIGDEGVLNAALPAGLSGVWIDPDLGWLDFNERVLAEALDERTPLLESAKFLAIFTSNLDEFFMKRIAVLRHGGSGAGETLLQQIRDKLIPMLRRQAACYRDIIIPGLARRDVFLRRWDELTAAQKEEAGDYFDTSLSPALTPLVIDPAHPFPFLSNLSTSLTFPLHDPQREETIYARVKVPDVLKQWVPLTSDLGPGQKLFVPLHELIRGNADRLYNGMTLTAATLVRLTRDAEPGNEDEEEPSAGLRELVEEQVRQRRYEPVVRLEFGLGADPAIREMLRERFELSPAVLQRLQVSHLTRDTRL
jgi:polyphosphate kinase